MDIFKWVFVEVYFIESLLQNVVISFLFYFERINSFLGEAIFYLV